MYLEINIIKKIYINKHIIKLNKAGIGPNTIKIKNPIKLRNAENNKIIARVLESLNPSSNNKWWTCLLSGINGLIPLDILLIKTAIKSKTGIVTHQIVKTGWITNFSDWENKIKNQDTKKPSVILPESPKKIFETLVKLKNRNNTKETQIIIKNS